jgi:predicted RNase H-like nuclease (RuvC/YqgF family)
LKSEERIKKDLLADQ